MNAIDGTATKLVSDLKIVLWKIEDKKIREMIEEVMNNARGLMYDDFNSPADISKILLVEHLNEINEYCKDNSFEEYLTKINENAMHGEYD